MITIILICTLQFNATSIYRFLDKIGMVNSNGLTSVLAFVLFMIMITVSTVSCTGTAILIQHGRVD